MADPRNDNPNENPSDTKQVQGEGDYAATRRYRKRTEEFLENNDVEKAALRAAPDDAQEAEEMAEAEEAGKSRAKAEDPALRRDPSKH
jgi:hypothetical protein